jgi:GNAT superfamily N-acetyltransferase
MILIRKAKKEDLKSMILVFKKSIHNSYDGAGEYYFKEEYVDPNYKSLTGPYYSYNLFLKNNLLSLKERIEKPYFCYVLLLDEKLIGYIIIEKHLKRFWVNDLIIDVKYQKKGYGEMLFKYALKDKKDVYIWVNEKNKAKKFWEKQGFKKVLTEVLMKK